VSFVEFLTAIIIQRARDLVETRPIKSNILTSIGTVFSTTKYCLMELVSILHNCMESIYAFLCPRYVGKRMFITVFAQHKVEKGPR